MIVRKHLRWRRVVSKSKGFLTYIGGLSTLVFAIHTFEPTGTTANLLPESLAYLLGKLQLDLPFPVVAMLATALAIFLAFRNNSAYDRWWEAREIWGGIVN